MAEVLRASKPLPRAFYERSALLVARELVGKVLVHRTAFGVACGRIVETEAYRGPKDLAAHTANGRRTPRNEAMWGEAGRAYVFQLYGVHWAFNAVTGFLGEPHAVLVRALEPVAPFELSEARRGMSAERRELMNGPGKLCAALGIGAETYGVDLCGTSALTIVEGLPRARVARSARINVAYAGEWAKRLWRYYEAGNRWVSVKPRD